MRYRTFSVLMLFIGLGFGALLPSAVHPVHADTEALYDPDPIEKLGLQAIFTKINEFNKMIQPEMAIVASHAQSRISADEVRHGRPPLPANVEVTLDPQTSKWKVTIPSPMAVPIAPVSTATPQK